MLEFTLLSLTFFLAYANGANDNFKGVATLYGSGVLSFQAAKILSAVSTIIGCVLAVAFAGALAKAFSGRGLVPDTIVAAPAFASAVALAAGATVLLATWLSMPISTTHALVGALAGAGWVAASGDLNLKMLGQQFVAPLVVGPLMALTISAGLNRVVRSVWPSTRRSAAQACVCVVAHSPLPAYSSTYALTNSIRIETGTISDPNCRASPTNFPNTILQASSALNAAHIVSGALVCFARGLNDAPKIVGVLLVLPALDLKVSSAAVALAMLMGGWLHAHKIAETMAHKIVQLEPRGAFLANVVTAFLLIACSKLGLPLSTTHVSVAAISGLSFAGAASAKLSFKTIKYIALSWIFTLPMAALIASALYPILNKLLT